MDKIRAGMDVDKAVARYTESAILSAVRLIRYWKSRGYSEEEAVNKAVNQALGMIKSGDPKRTPELIGDIEKMCRVLKKKTVSDCTCCPFMPSLDLFRQDEIRKKEAGGELNVLYLTTTDPNAIAIYHNTGGLIGSLEDILIGYKERVSEAGYIHLFSWHFLRDLKASSFFAFCGRYKQASQILRSAIELMFTGIYFQELKDKGEEEKLHSEWEKWMNGKKINGFSNGLRISMSRGLLTQKAKKDAGKLYGNLSKAVHTLIREDGEIIVSTNKRPARPASAFFNLEFLREWFEYLFQEVIIVYEMILALSLKPTEKSTEGLDMLSIIINGLQKNKEKPLPFVECPKLKNCKNYQKIYE